ncbi:hypothetical protein [Herbihabitans rhizosphaerae]|nr:hypothetical protein [Herbihabitans rhizosphaerae]
MAEKFDPDVADELPWLKEEKDEIVKRIGELHEVFPNAWLLGFWIKRYYRMEPSDGTIPGAPGSNHVFDDFFDCLRFVLPPSRELIEKSHDTMVYGSGHTMDCIPELTNGIAAMHKGWSGDAALAVGDLATRFQNYMEDQAKVTLRLAECMTAYLGMVEGARRSLNDIIDRAIQAFIDEEEADEAALLSVIITAIVGVATAAVTLGASAIGTAATQAFSKLLMTEVLKTAISTAGTTASNAIGGTDPYKIGDQYLEAVASVQGDVTTGISETVSPELGEIIKAVPRPPKMDITEEDLGNRSDAPN